MTTEEKIKAIETWTNKFMITKSYNKWYAKIQYKKGSIMHSTMYFNYDQMVNSTYNLLASRVWGVVVAYLENGR